MDEPLAGGEHSSVIAPAASRFYPHGVRCTGCGYDLAGCSATCCPECGDITADLAYPGRARPISDPERERAQDLRFGASPWAAIAAARGGTGQLTGVLVLFGILAFVVFPLMRAADRMLDPAGIAIRAVGAGLGVLAVFAVVHLGVTWERIRRTAAARNVSLAADLTGERVEEYHHELTHAMRIPDEGGECLLLRFHGGYVLGLRPGAQRRLGMPADVLVRQRVRLSILPRSRGVVGVEFEGEEAPTSRRPDLRLRRAHPGAGDPVVGAATIAPLILVPRGSRPAFSPDGPPAGPGAT